jgi:uncharacterized lipoprotein YbaY
MTDTTRQRRGTAALTVLAAAACLLAGCSPKEPEPTAAPAPNPAAAAQTGLSSGSTQSNLGSMKGRIAPPTQ